MEPNEKVPSIQATVPADCIYEAGNIVRPPHWSDKNETAQGDNRFNDGMYGHSVVITFNHGDSFVNVVIVSFTDAFKDDS